MLIFLFNFPSNLFVDCLAKPYASRTSHLHNSYFNIIFIFSGKDERTVKVEVCPRDNERGMIMLYWASQNTCAPMWKIPRGEGGFKPECSGIQDGVYADSATRCAYYFRCESDDVTWYKRCPRGKAYDQESQSCITAAYTKCSIS